MGLLARLWALRRERPVFVAVSLLVLGYVLAYPAIDWWLRSIGIAPPFGFWDFGAYSGAVDRWLDGEAIYRQNDAGGYHGTFLYPPVIVLLFVPFAKLPAVVPFAGLSAFQTSAIAWVATAVLTLWLGLQLAIEAVGPRLSLPERGLLLWALLGFQPFLFSIKMGQMAGFLTGLLCVSLAALVRGGRSRHLASGAFTAVVGVIKLSYATAGAHLLAERDRFRGALLAGAGLLVVSLLVFGVDRHLTYLDVLAWGIGQGDSARSAALWMVPYYRPVFWLPATMAIRVLGALLIAVGAVCSPPEARRETFALGVAAIPLLSPVTYTYYFVPLLAAFAALVAVEFDRDGYPTIPVVALFLLSVHAYGLRFVVTSLLPPATLQPLAHLVAPTVVYALLQPGLWGNLLFVALAGVRVAERLELPARIVRTSDGRVERVDR